MAEWFYQFHKKLLEFPPALWGALLILAIGGIFIWLTVTKRYKALIVSISSIMFVSLLVLVAFFIPPMDLEEGATTSIIYQTWFWSLIVIILLIVFLALMIRRQVWTAKMLATGAVCIAMSVLLAAIRLYRLPNGGSFAYVRELTHTGGMRRRVALLGAHERLDP